MKSKVLFATIVSFLCFSLSTIGIMASVPQDKKEIKDDKVVVKSNVEEMTVEVTEAEPEEETFEEETTKKKKKKKKLKPLTIGNDDSGSDDSDSGNDYSDYDSGSSNDYGFDDSSYDDGGSSGGGAVNNYYYNDGGSSSKKKHKTKKKNNSNNNSYNYSKPKVKKKAIKTQSEKNVLSGNKVNLLRSQIKHKISGSQNKEMTNLAKYMARNGLSNASSAYKKLTNVNGNVSCATYKLKVSTNDQLAILEATNKVHELSAGKYGIGICSTEASVGYKIYVVICYR